MKRIVLILAIALAAVFVLVLLFSKQPAAALYWFFLGPLRNTYHFGNMINSAVPLIFGGLGAAIAMEAGVFNLGGEGQIYAGAFVTAIAALYLAPLGLAGAAAALLAGTVFAGLAAAASGLLKVKWNTNELITTFLLSNVLILVTGYCITGPFLDPDTSLQSTRKIAEAFRLPRILPPSGLSAALFPALAAAAAVHVFLYRTRAGYAIRIRGCNPVFARYGGLDTGFSAVLAMFLSGALYGMGGGLAIYGTYYAAIKDFSSGMGWNGLAVALIARGWRFRGGSAAAVIPAAVFFAWIGAGGRLAMQFSDVTLEISSIVQAVVFLFVTSSVVLGEE